MSFCLILILTSAWYWTSSINAVASQRLVQTCSDGASPDVAAQVTIITNKELLCSPTMLMVTLTWAQLILGTVICIPLLLLVQLLLSKSTTSSGIDKKKKKRMLKLPSSGRDVTLGALHFCGCLCTNIGYAFGSAVLVQIIKMLEPIETIILSSAVNILFWRRASSMARHRLIGACFICSGTVIILSAQKVIVPNPTSVMFALASGAFMSSRNVAKKTFAEIDAGNNCSQQRTTRIPTPSTELPYNNINDVADDKEQQQQQKQHATTVLKPLEKIEIGLQNFLLITISSSMFAVTGLVLALTAGGDLRNSVMLSWAVLLSSKSGFRAIVFHCLFNIASISVLGLVSATTHSLLNAGKRVFNVVVAAIIFSVPLGANGSIGMLVAGVGALLYSGMKIRLVSMSRPSKLSLITILLLLSFPCVIHLYLLSLAQSSSLSANTLMRIIIMSSSSKV